jgi:hemerythrin
VGLSGLIGWEDGFSVGVAEIDAQHRRLIATIGALADSMAKGAESSSLEGVFSELAAYANAHSRPRRDICGNCLPQPPSKRGMPSWD